MLMFFAYQHVVKYTISFQEKQQFYALLPFLALLKNQSPYGEPLYQVVPSRSGD